MNRFALLLFPALLLLAACPTVKLGAVTIADAAPKAGTFTLVVDVVVEETEVTDGESGQPTSGRAVVGMHLPPAWKVTASRMKAPQESVMRRNYASPQSAGIFADTFPTVTDSWWAFSSAEQTITQGKHEYRAEFDIDAGTDKAGDVGILLSILQEDMKDLPAPVAYTVSIKGKKTTIKAKAGGAAPATGAGKDKNKVPAGP